MIEKKLQGYADYKVFSRKRVDEWLLKNTFSYSNIFLCGIRGCGKTTEICSFAQKHYKDRYGYYSLDTCDNDITQFQAYFLAMLDCAGIRIHNTKEVSDRIFNTLCNMTEKICLIFDNIDLVTNSDVRIMMKNICLYSSSKVHVIFIANNSLDEEWKGILDEVDTKPLKAQELAWCWHEMGDYFRENGWEYTEQEKRNILHVTNGWAGLMNLYHRCKKEKDAMEHVYDPLEKFLLEDFDIKTYCDWMERNVWKEISDGDRNTLSLLHLLGVIAPEFLQEEIKTETKYFSNVNKAFWNMENMDYIQCVFDENYYQESPWMCAFLEMKEKWNDNGQSIVEEKMVNQAMANQAIQWFERKNQIMPGIRYMLYQGQPDKLEQYLMKHVKDAVHVLGKDEIKTCLTILETSTKSIMYYFLKGFLGAEIRDYTILDQAKKCLEMRCHDMETTHDEKNYTILCNMIINLDYYDPRQNAIGWLEGSITKKQKMEDKWFQKWNESICLDIELYDVTRDTPTILCGRKDLAEYFMEGQRVEKKYKKQWDSLLKADQIIYFLVASIEYLMETNREKEAYGMILPLIPSLEYKNDPETLAVLLSILTQLFDKGFLKEEMHSLTAKIIGNMDKSSYKNLVMNTKFKMMFSSLYHISHTQRMHIVENEKIKGMENGGDYYKRYLMACYYFENGTYKLAELMYHTLTDLYEIQKNTMHQAACLFGEAVCLYAQENVNGALKLTIQSMTIGAHYRYVGIYTKYGKQGLELLKQYQRLMTKQDSKIMRKKKYYYGNILRASFEEYQDILIRVAGKEARQYEKTHKKTTETLTNTELGILRFMEKGYGNAEIAEIKDIQVTTVKTHISSIFHKLEVKNRGAAVLKAREYHLI